MADWVVKQGIAITVLIVAVCYLANENRTTVLALTTAINANSASCDRAFQDLKAIMIEFRYELRAMHSRTLPPASNIPKIADGGGGDNN